MEKTDTTYCPGQLDKTDHTLDDFSEMTPYRNRGSDKFLARDAHNYLYTSTYTHT